MTQHGTQQLYNEEVCRMVWPGLHGGRWFGVCNINVCGLWSCRCCVRTSKALQTFGTVPALAVPHDTRSLHSFGAHDVINHGSVLHTVCS